MSILIKVAIFYMIYRLAKSTWRSFMVASGSTQEDSDIIEAEFKEIDPDKE